MVCDTESPGNRSSETVWIGAGAFRGYLAGDWMKRLDRSIEHVDHVVPPSDFDWSESLAVWKPTHNLKPSTMDSHGMVIK